MNREDLHVGQRVWVSRSYTRGEPVLGEVIKIGLVLVSITPVYPDGKLSSRPSHYRISEQTENVKDPRCSFRTFEQHEKSVYESEVNKYFRGTGISFGWKCEIDFADRVKLMELLKGLGYEPAQE